MTVQLRFALLYAGAFTVTGLVLTLALLEAGSETYYQQAGSAGLPRAVWHPLIDGSPGVIALVLVVLVLLSVALGWLLASRLLRPVRLITAAARDISASNLSRRLRTGRRDDEFSRLGETLNDLFARLEASFRAQRHFVANASHELRTPLAVERTLLQVALDDPEAAPATLREACEEVLALGVRTERLIDSLLTLASGERGIERREPFDLADLAARVALAQGKEAVRRDVRLEVTLSPAPAGGDPRLAESLIANLADNALRYNVPGGWAGLSTATRDGQAVVSVRNTGPAIPPGQVDRLFQPFQRLGTERVQRSRGHGLGLAIVRAIADAHAASVTARVRPGGGLDIDVAFPGPGAHRHHGGPAAGDIPGRPHRRDPHPQGDSAERHAGQAGRLRAVPPAHRPGARALDDERVLGGGGARAGHPRAGADHAGQPDRAARRQGGGDLPARGRPWFPDVRRVRGDHAARRGRAGGRRRAARPAAAGRAAV